MSGAGLSGDMEDVKRVIAQRLRAPIFAEILAAIDTDKGDGAVTPAPVAVFEGWRAVQMDEPFPVCAVIGLRTAYDQEDNHAKDRSHEVVVHFTMVHQDELVLGRVLERLVRATVEYFHNRPLEEVHAYPVAVVADEYTLMVSTADEHGPFIQEASTQLAVRTIAL